MNNYKFTISYDSSRYYGWEHQPGKDLTIQGKIETVLARMTGSDSVDVISAGRTDAGVHALALTANARLNTDLSPQQIRDYMNRYLPEDICIRDVRIASDKFHARYNCIGKTYRYTCYIGQLKPVFDRKYVYVLDKMPDVEKMREAAGYLTGKHDFASFCGNVHMKKSTVRTLDTIDIRVSGDYLTFTYHGDGFLRSMVRILTGTLLEVGWGKRTPESMPSLFHEKRRALAGFTVPAKGLCLIQDDYNRG